jgi:hypothetical protein
MKVVGPDLLAKGLRRAQPIRLGQQEKLVRHLLPAGDGCPGRPTPGRPGQSSPAQPPVFSRRVTRLGLPSPTPRGRQPWGVCLFAPSAVKVARWVQERARRVIAAHMCRSKPSWFSSSTASRTAGRAEVCDQDTAPGRKCPDRLAVMKGGASPPLGGAGKPRNQCQTRWQQKQGNALRRLHKRSAWRGRRSSR